MNKLLLLSAALTLAFQPCAAQPDRHRGHAYDMEFAEPHVDSMRLRAAALTAYYADQLQLHARQLPALRQCVQQRLEVLDSLDRHAAAAPLTETALSRLNRQYHAAVLRVLTPGQYGSFVLLEELPARPDPQGSSLAVHR